VIHTIQYNTKKGPRSEHDLVPGRLALGFMKLLEQYLCSVLFAGKSGLIKTHKKMKTSQNTKEKYSNPKNKTRN
jgi:hypothetical protein